MKHITIMAALLGILAAALARGAPAVEPTERVAPGTTRMIAGKRVVGYAVAKRQELFNDPAIRDFIFSNITHVVLIEGATANSNGVVRVNEKSLINAVSVSHSKNCKISATFTGPYRHLFANSAAKATFITNIVDTCRKYRLDGADFDYEYPENMKDRIRFEVFLKELRSAAPVGMLLSAAVSAWENSRELVPVGAVSDLDWIFLMGYGTTPDRMKHENNVKELQNCLKWGVPASKLVLGLPIYGSRMGPDGQGQDGPGYASIIGTNILDRTVDEFNGWHFNGPATIEKNTQYVYDSRMGGVGWWHLTLDTLDGRSLTLTAANTLRILNERNAVDRGK